MAFYKKRVVTRDTQADIDERIAAAAASKQAFDETMAKFGSITEANVADAIAFQDRRRAELMVPIHAAWKAAQ